MRPPPAGAGRADADREDLARGEAGRNDAGSNPAGSNHPDSNDGTAEAGGTEDAHVDNVREQLEERARLTARIAREMAAEIEVVIGRVLECVRAGGKLLFCGNGGSAADAQHLAAEYVVRFSRERTAIAAIALTTDTSVLTAAGNDIGFERVFERQVRALARAGDLLVLLSTSGESENLLRAAGAARELGVGTVALLARGGGRLSERVDYALIVPTDSTARAQELQLTIGHVVCDLVERAVAPGDGTAREPGTESAP